MAIKMMLPIFKEEKLIDWKFFTEINEIEKHAGKESAMQAKVVPMYRQPWSVCGCKPATSCWHSLHVTREQIQSRKIVHCLL